MDNYRKVDKGIKAQDFDYEEIEEVDDPVKLVYEEYVKPRQNKEHL